MQIKQVIQAPTEKHPSVLCPSHNIPHSEWVKNVYHKQIQQNPFHLKAYGEICKHEESNCVIIRIAVTDWPYQNLATQANRLSKNL